MASGIREFLDKPAGKATAIVVILCAIALCLYSLKSSMSTDEATGYSQDPWFVCAETGKAFHHALQAGEKFPVYSSASGKNTAYPAELCYWTKDAKIKNVPTPVLLNDWTGKPGPTFCPECGRLVVGHNPAPDPKRPPPTKEEYMKKGIALSAQQAANQ
jgi:hypothetical protein